MPSSRRIALITGGARGIGLGIAESLAAEGFDLMLNGIRPKKQVTGILKSLREQGAEVRYCQADISHPDQREQLINDVQKRFGGLHVLVNNAGITSVGRKDVLEADEEGFDRVLSVNLKGPYFLTQLAARWMIEQQQTDREWTGCVVNITSISAEFVSCNRGDYCLSKAALAMATKVWAVRLAEHEIPVYEVRPGVISSDMTAEVRDKYDRAFAEGLALQRRWGEPGDVGRAVAMLVRGDLPYATGQVLRVDGGMTIQTM